ncbi:MAG: class IV adenylate cyclase [Methanomicrobiales archaeon]
MLEIELKVEVPDLAPVRERLLAIGAHMTEKTGEHDRYYNAPHRDFAITDEALRVRYSTGRTIITYKGAKRRDLSFKAREELNVIVDEGASFEQMLERIGFRKTAVVDKVREYYSLGQASIALDEVAGLGSFVEIEVMRAESDVTDTRIINEIAEKIGAGGEPILASYLELILAKQ